MKIYDVIGIGANLTGSFSGSFNGLFTGTVAGVSATASYVEYTNVANKPTLVSGSSQVTYSGLTGVPVGIVSGSAQVVYSGLTGIPSGILSGSAQIADFGIFATTGSNQFNGSQAITGSLTVTGAIVAQTLNVQQVTSSVVFSSGSNVFGNSLGNTQQFTGSMSVTGSLTVNGTSTVVGSGSSNYVPKFTGASTIGNSLLSENGSIVSVIANSAGLRVTETSGADLRMAAGGSSGFFGTYSNHSLQFLTNSGTKATLDASGNLGLGVTPSAWRNTNPAFQIGQSTSLFGYSSSNIGGLASNAFINSSGNEIYISNGFSSLYQFGNNGEHRWLNAPSGTAGNAITFTQAMTLDASGRLGIGTPSPTEGKLVVSNSGPAIIYLKETSVGVNAYWNASDGSIVLFGSVSNHPLTFVTNNTARLTIASTGAATFSSSVFAGGSVLSSPSGADTIIGAFGGQDCSLILQDAVQLWELYVNDDFYINRGSTNVLTALRSNGNVGIGTASFSGKFNVTGGSGNPADDAAYANLLVTRLQNISQAYLEIRSTESAQAGLLLKGTGLTGSQHFLVGLNNDSKLRIGFGTGITDSKDGVNGITIQSNGNVGIGTATPDTFSYGGNRNFLTLRGSATNQEPFLQIIANGVGNSLIDFGNESIRRATIIGENGSNLAFYTNGTNSGTGVTERMRVTSGGNVLIGTTTDSGERLRLDGRIGIINATVASGNTRSFFVRGAQNVANDATLTLTIANTSLVFIAENNTGTGALFFLGYASANITKISDPSNIFATFDTSDKLCIFKSAASDVATVRNRLGSSKSITVSYIGVSD